MANMNEYIHHNEFFRRLQEDAGIFGGTLITDYRTLQQHIRVFEGYAAYVQECIQAETMPKPFDVFHDEFLYPSSRQ